MIYAVKIKSAAGKNFPVTHWLSIKNTILFFLFSVEKAVFVKSSIRKNIINFAR